jgi:hypothetical protein
MSEDTSTSTKAAKKAKTPKADVLRTVRKFHVIAQLLSPILGTVPDDPSIAMTHLNSQDWKARMRLAKINKDFAEIARLNKAADERVIRENSTFAKERAKTATVAVSSAENEEEAEEANREIADEIKPPEDDDSPVPSEARAGSGADNPETRTGKTVFRRTHSVIENVEDVPMLVGYMIRGFYKEAFETYTGVYQPVSMVDKFLWVGEFEIPFFRDGKPLADVDVKEWSRPLRTTDRKTRISTSCISKSEVINPIGSTTIEYNVFLMPKGAAESYLKLNLQGDEFERITSMALMFGGLGQFRNGGHGCFEVIHFKEEEIGWKEAWDIRKKMLVDGQQTYKGLISPGVTDTPNVPRE